MNKLDEDIAKQIRVMFDCLAKHESSLFAPSAFWSDLCEQHMGLLQNHGFDRFKRTLNFQYGQWGIGSLRDWRIRHVAKQLLGMGRLPYMGLFARLRDAGDVLWPRKTPTEPNAYRVFVGLVWQLALARDRIGCLRTCEEPRVGGPIEITYRGRLITQDMAQSSLELNSIMNQIGAGTGRKVAEIGGGSGRFAYLFMRTFTDTHYCIFDIPPALAISQNHLAGALGEQCVTKFDADSGRQFHGRLTQSGQVSSYLPFSLESVPDGYFDLLLNVSSFDEMLPKQVDCYFDLIDRKCSGWLYLKGYSTRTGEDPTRPLGLDNFP